jgi:hypothetical protein
VAIEIRFALPHAFVAFVSNTFLFQGSDNKEISMSNLLTVASDLNEFSFT